ncbi:MAG: hypothetical protein ABI885_05555 [Gammaproteobacteria bacterium]
MRAAGKEHRRRAPRYFVLDEYDNTYYGSPASYALGVNVRA